MDGWMKNLSSDSSSSKLGLQKTKNHLVVGGVNHSEETGSHQTPYVERADILQDKSTNMDKEAETHNIEIQRQEGLW